MFYTRLLLISFLSTLFLTPHHTEGGRAPDKKPGDLPKDFCPRNTGIMTATTGECMCKWQDKNGCEGSGCQFAYGLSFYHYSCTDCRCVPEP